jgi:2-methylcitrate dehydratase PrpD
MSVARKLAELVTQTAYADLPDQTIDHAAMMIASTIASAAGGRNIQSAAIIRDLARERGGAPEAPVWFEPSLKLPAIYAARVNALMSDAAASDDSDLRNITHAGTPLTATSLALAARTGASGADVLAAMVLGYEAAGRIGESITPEFRKRGFHACLIASFSAAVAAGRLLGLDSDQMTHAIALNATSVGGLIKAADTSVAREYHAGQATMAGIDAAMAAQLGYTGEADILEMPGGFCATYGGSNGGGIGDNWGAEWDIVTDMAIKLVPGSHFQHSMAEAAANAARKGDIAAADIKSITLSRPGMTQIGGPRHPKDLIDMAHSAAYFMAAGAADHEFTWAHATPKKIADPVIHGLIDKVQIGPEPTENIAAYRQGATVTIETTDGRSVTDTVLVPNGAGCLGIDWSDIDAKYRNLAPAALNAEQVAASLTVLHDFRQVTDVSALTDLLG